MMDLARVLPSDAVLPPDAILSSDLQTNSLFYNPRHKLSCLSEDNKWLSALKFKGLSKVFLASLISVLAV